MLVKTIKTIKTKQEMVLEIEKLFDMSLQTEDDCRMVFEKGESLRKNISELSISLNSKNELDYKISKMIELAYETFDCLVQKEKLINSNDFYDFFMKKAYYDLTKNKKNGGK